MRFVVDERVDLVLGGVSGLTGSDGGLCRGESEVRGIAEARLAVADLPGPG